MNWFKRQPKVEFVSTIPGLLDLNVITPMGSFRPAWLTKEIADYKANKRNSSNLDERTSLVRCAGIRKLYTTGWVVRAWQDIEVDIKPDGTFTWKTPIDQADLRLGSVNVNYAYVTHHSTELFKHSEYFSRKPLIMKLQCPIFAKIPKGYNMIEMPVPYQEHDNFYSAMGIFERSFGFFELNVQLIWNRPGKFVVEAGTPVSYITLIKDEPTLANFRDATQDELLQIRSQSLFKGTSKTSSHRQIKSAIRKLMGD
jgi:hypothetical protein